MTVEVYRMHMEYCGLRLDENGELKVSNEDLDDFGKYYCKNRKVIEETYRIWESNLLDFYDYDNEDCFQDFIIQILKRFEKYATPEAIKEMTIHKMNSKMRYFLAQRRHYTREFKENGEEILNLIEEVKILPQEDIMDLKETLVKLTEEERQVLVAIMLGYNMQEIGDKLGCTRQTASKKVKIAQEKAKLLLENAL